MQTIFKKLSPRNQTRISRMLRVNQAGELGAVRIYQGQLGVMSRSRDGPILKHMLAQEQLHRSFFNQALSETGSRPTLMTPVWHLAGYALGVGTALLGRNAAMLCTEAVETVIGDHYNDQLRELVDIERQDGVDLSILKSAVQKFRDEELQHLDHAVGNGALESPARPVLSGLIQQGCRSAIWISERI